MFSTIVSKIFGTANLRKLKTIQPIVAHINSLEPQMMALSDEQLSQKTQEFRSQLSSGKTLDDILPQAFAVVRETARRKLNMRHYDVQLIGGIVLHQGKIAEMKTGEGKTLTATLPLYLNGLSGKGAHLVTVNDYLARRDADWMRPIYEHLGLTVGVLQNQMDDEQRQQVYACDIVYATNNELGFDYLRDNMKFRLQDYVQRDLNFAIVDEVDSILIDEARTPLIISGAADESSELYLKINQIVKNLKAGADYEVDEKARSVQLTEAGNDQIETILQVKNLYAPENLGVLHHVTQALRANGLFKRDVDYLVKDDNVYIIDEFTGRVLPGRRYSDGLHQALEAKEGVNVQRETQTLASITLQNFFRMYHCLAGMTGTAATEAEEFHNIYGLDVVCIPTNELMIRQDKSDLIFLSKNGKYKEILQDIKARVAKKQPVLIGTIAVETSELLSKILTQHGIQHQVLNAKQHEREAEIVANAGLPGTVTIATNMAGRGTDIKLDPVSIQAGGLYILGTERHESRRIDNQLRGRSGRQGDPGESRFYISLEDDLIRIFAGDHLRDSMQRYGMEEDEIIESSFVSKTIERAQQQVERNNFEVRKHLIEYDDVLNQHRTVVYKYRRNILESNQDIYEIVNSFIVATVQDLVHEFCETRKITQQSAQDVINVLSKITTIDIAKFADATIDKTNIDLLQKDLVSFLLAQYNSYRTQQDQEQVQQAERWMMLELIDKAWKQHMLNIDHLKEGINYRSWGQKNPLFEYKREAFVMFQDMMKSVRAEMLHHIFHLNLTSFNYHALEQRREKELEELQMLSGPSEDGLPVVKQVAVRHEGEQVGRNDQCNCGSGKKYKKCCLK
jgi:preprotein translocase subunit SecA